MRSSIQRRVNWNLVGLLLAAVVFGTPRTASADIVHNDDVIIDGSLAVGFDAVNGESFGFDTLRLKENNLRIHFDDTSTSASFPSNDWRITINDSSNGGLNKFSIDDATGGRTPFTIEAGAPSHSLYVEDGGRVGFGTNTPVVDLHVKSGNTPTLRLEQDGSSGFTPQTWDVAGNEAGFFVRDATNGSTLAFRIRPGAPTSALDIAADGDIGIGTSSPTGKMHIKPTIVNDVGLNVNDRTNILGDGRTFWGLTPTQGILTWDGSPNRAIIGGQIGNQLELYADGVAKVSVDLNGNVGIGNTAPTFDLEVGAAGAGSGMNAGDTAFTATSSRGLKENIRPVQADDILAKMANVPVMTYDWKPEAWGGEEKDRTDKMGLIAEDFYTVLERGSDKKINGQEVDMTLWLAVQQLHAQNKELKERLTQLEQQVQPEDKP